MARCTGASVYGDLERPRQYLTEARAKLAAANPMTSKYGLDSVWHRRHSLTYWAANAHSLRGKPARREGRANGSSAARVERADSEGHGGMVTGCWGVSGRTRSVWPS
jgi:hypothetical protein